MQGETCTHLLESPSVFDSHIDLPDVEGVFTYHGYGSERLALLVVKHAQMIHEGSSHRLRAKLQLLIHHVHTGAVQRTSRSGTWRLL